MMENAGRNLALHVIDMLDGKRDRVTILAGAGGNGGGGLCRARHLHNRGFETTVVPSSAAEELEGAAQNQLRVLQVAGVQPTPASHAGDAIQDAGLVVDALIGYGLRGAARGLTAELIGLSNQHARALSLDVPSDLSATGEALEPVAHPERTLTLALPKTGLQETPGELYLADIGIPPAVYQHLGLSVPSLFGKGYWVRLEVS
jgi:NAD(P)H-hydrate epimerase